MAINYNPVGWDPTKKFEPTNMVHMDAGIKSACDGVDGMGSYKKNISVLNEIDVLSTAYDSGKYYVNNCDGLPNGEKYGYLDAEILDNSWKKLVFTSYTNDSTYVITLNDGTWSGWKKLVHFSEDNITPNTEYIDKYRIWRVSELTIISFSTKKECPAWGAHLFYGVLSNEDNYIQDFNGNSYKASYNGLEPTFYMAIGDYTIISIMN